MGNAPAEALLISALLKKQDVLAAEAFGVHQTHFRGFSQEYAWLQHYHSTYGDQPSQDAFFNQFPDFPYRDHDNVRYAAEEVLKDFAQRRLNELTIQAMEAAEMGDVSGAFQVLQSYHYTPTSAVPTSLITGEDFFNEFDKPSRGITVPWPTLQDATAGIMPGQFWVVAARLNQGKSALLCAAAVQAVLAGKRVLYYSLEMTDSELRGRIHVLLAAALGEDWLKATDIKHRTVDIRRYRDFVRSLPDRGLGELHVHTPSDGLVSPATVASRADEYDLVTVDYLTLMHSDSGEPASNDWRTVTQISNRIKHVALATDTPILAASQINRDGDHGDNPPRVGQIAQGDSIGQDADVVITMRSKPGGVAAVASLEKNRHGPAGFKWWMRFSVNDGLFDEINEDRAEALVMAAEEAAHTPKLKIVRN